MRRTLFQRVIAMALVISCAASQAFAADGVVRGRVQYEKILYRHPTTGALGLQLGNPVLMPVIGARVELIDDASKQPIANAITDGTGQYRLSWSSASMPMARVRVLADTEYVVVVNHLDPKTTYSTLSEPWQLTNGEVEKNVLAVDKTRESGPFNMLAVIRQANLYLKAADGKMKFEKIKIRWTTRPVDPKSRYYTSQFDPISKEAHILGDRDVDSDEFDDFILLHEYGHFLASVYARDDTPAGPHGTGMKLDPRLAWSEGWATYLACAVLNDTRYIDTGRGETNPHVRVYHDYSQAIAKNDRPGYWSEFTVASALWGLHREVGFAKIWHTFINPWKKRLCGGLVEFCDELVRHDPSSGPKVASVLATRGIKYRPGAAPSVDGYTGHRPLPLGVPQLGTLDGLLYGYAAAYDTAALYTLTLPKKEIVNLRLDILRSKAPKTADLDLYLFTEKGRPIGSTANNGVKGFESITRELDAGTYVVEVRSWAGKTRNVGTYRLVANVATQIEGKVARTDGPIIVTNAVSDKRGLVPGDKTVKLPGKVHETGFEAGKTYQIDVVSKEPLKGNVFTFDPVVVMQDGDGKQLGFDDDKGGNRNARMIVTAAKTQSYKIMVGAIIGQGAYTVIVTPLGSSSSTVEVPANGLNLPGRLDGLTKEVIHELKLQAGKTYVIDMTTQNPQAIDPLLILEDAAGTKVAEDDDGGGNRDARITFTARVDGTYQLVATSYGQQGRGDYGLTVRLKE